MFRTTRKVFLYLIKDKIIFITLFIQTILLSRNVQSFEEFKMKPLVKTEYFENHFQNIIILIKLMIGRVTIKH